MKTRWRMPISFKSPRITLFVMAAMASEALAAEKTDLSPLVEANTAFVLQLYGKVRSADGNLVLSPCSISAALAMTYAGARGDTARQMAQTLHFDPSDTGLHERFGRLDATLKAAQGQNELIIANSLWPQAKYPLRDEFLRLLKSDYGATVTPLDYEREAERARATINRWVDDKTKHKIKELIGPNSLEVTTRMVLVNAIYFKGTWATPFLESNTQPDTFSPRPDTTLTVPFMHRRGNFRYGENNRVQLLALPYTGGHLEMVFLLPRSRDGIGSMESGLTPADLAAWTADMREREVNVALPKFKMSSGFSLAEALKAMGLTDAFDRNRADFSGMDGEAHSLYINDMIHKASIEVNEKGTEAAAATVVHATEAGPIARDFKADHPFVFLVRDSTTGSILFTGRVMKPGD